MKISTNQFKNGTKILIDNAPCSIVEHEFHKPGKGQAVMRVKYKNLLTLIFSILMDSHKQERT